MRSAWLKIVLIVSIIVIVILMLHYREANKDIPLSEIFPEEHASPVDIEFADENAAIQNQSVNQTVNQKLKQKNSVSPAVKTPPASGRKENIQMITPKPVPEGKSTAAVKPKSLNGTVQNSTPNPDQIKVIYTIQVVSSKDQAKAEGILKNLKSKNYDAFVLPVEVKDKGTWYRIYVGHFNSKAEADQYLPNLKKDFPNGFVIIIKA